MRRRPENQKWRVPGQKLTLVCSAPSHVSDCTVPVRVPVLSAHKTLASSVLPPCISTFSVFPTYPFTYLPPWLPLNSDILKDKDCLLVSISSAPCKMPGTHSNQLFAEQKTWAKSRIWKDGSWEKKKIKRREREGICSDMWGWYRIHEK